MNAFELDSIDFRILATVQSNARISLSHLASEVGLSVSPCSTRLKRLEQKGFISGYVAVIDESKFGDFAIVFAEVTLIDQQEKTYKAFEELVRGTPEILEWHPAAVHWSFPPWPGRGRQAGEPHRPR